MKWFIYSISPIDFKWERMRSVRETISHLALTPDVNADDKDVADLKVFIDSWESAKNAALAKGWDGDFRNPPVVFWMPSDDEFTYGFVIKQDNNGDTFVISTVELPWLM